MGGTRGCFKVSCLGCLGLLALLFLIAAIVAVLAWTGRDRQQIENRELGSPADPAFDPTAAPGRLVLELDGGAFRILPGEPGEGIRVEGRYDAEVHELSDGHEILPDSSWVYTVRFRRTMPALQTLFRHLMGGTVETWVDIHVPPDLPLSLDLRVRNGGLEADLGGLWLREADIRCSRGGFSLEVSRPLREPMERLTIVGRMGGLDASDLGNASPRALSVDYRMGGAALDLRGAWLGDADIVLAISMGGMSVVVPEEVEATGLPGDAPGLRDQPVEVPVPVLRFTSSQSMGEIEFNRR